MSHPALPDLKKEFGLERLILFSDAVFAIAITLLVLEIKVPEIEPEKATDPLLLHDLGHLIPKFIGFLVSFFVIGLYWTIHHRMFGYVNNYTRGTLWLNLIFLLAVVLMPFSTAVYSEYSVMLLKTPVFIYVGNICFLGFTNYFLWRHVAQLPNGLSQEVSERDRKYLSIRYLLVPLIFLVMLLIYLYVNPYIAFWVPMTIPFMMKLLSRWHRRKVPQVQETA